MRWATPLLLCLVVALAAPPTRAQEPGPAPGPAASAWPDVRAQVGEGIAINWTRLVLEVTRSARGYGVGSSMPAVEQEARRLVGPALLQGVQAIPVTAGKTWSDLESDPALVDALRSRLERWSVSEARYFASGRVELVGELSLQQLLKPWTLSVARDVPEAEQQPRYTGVIVDARGAGVSPSFAPRLLDLDGKVLYDGALWRDKALDQVPAVWVVDPAHPLVIERTGDDPLVVRCERASGSDLVLLDEDAIRFWAAMRTARVMGEGKLVVVVDAP